MEDTTAPLVLRLPSGDEKVVARAFPHPRGVLYLDLFWHQSTPAQAAHLLIGELQGDGPWKVGRAIIRVLGCAHTDPQLQNEYARWRDYLSQHSDDYPPEAQIREIAKKLGCRF